jgi:hypothetical protein
MSGAKRQARRPTMTIADDTAKVVVNQGGVV